MEEENVIFQVFYVFFNHRRWKKVWYLLMTFLCWSSPDTPICKAEWTMSLTVAISVSLAWVSTAKHSREGSGCDKKDSVKQLMSLSITAPAQFKEQINQSHCRWSTQAY